MSPAKQYEVIVRRAMKRAPEHKDYITRLAEAWRPALVGLPASKMADRAAKRAAKSSDPVEWVDAYPSAVAPLERYP